MRKSVYGGPRALAPGAARHEMARWLAGAREVIRVLFPEEVASHKPRLRGDR
ncbi:hypothetical protein FHS95_001377 [Sphingomonas naasensis]|uniref:hypothetical protein n=1 Tax=Sphingomonas naasensis TaxID=1344951 RepID=UPI00141AD676|nr:hypothetical protein [Sphingomonas naasensis]NIJ19708.1 hypothetical protein [Sphingomonas naasensis]